MVKLVEQLGLPLLLLHIRKMVTEVVDFLNNLKLEEQVAKMLVMVPEQVLVGTMEEVVVQVDKMVVEVVRVVGQVGMVVEVVVEKVVVGVDKKE